MDWTKAKTILIVALIITNIFLIVTYGFGEDEQGEIADQQVLIEVLESKNIFLDMEIPQKHKSMPMLSIAYATNDEELEREEMQKNTVPLSGDNTLDYGTAADMFVEGCGYMTESVSLNRIEFREDEVKVYYINTIDNIAIEESYMICTFEGDRLVDFERYWLQPTGLSKKKVETVSAAAALISFMSQGSERESEEPIFIEDMELVYWLADTDYSMEAAVSDTAFPAWRITYNDGQKAYVSAGEL